jgi:multidrug efflux pump
MFLSDISVKRPVFASVISLLLIVFGIVSFSKLPLREYPNIDPPIVSIETTYRGAAANIVETRITKLVEDSISGVEGIHTISSSSEDGRSLVTVKFNIERDIDNAANDIRDKVSTIADNLPEEADAPEVQKANADDDVIIWFNLNGEGMSIMELTDYAHRYLVDRFSALDGVARIRIGGGKERAMRIWLNREALAGRSLTASDVEKALRSENIELPAGQVESEMRDFTVRMQRDYVSVEDFENLVISKGKNGYLVRLEDVAKVEIAPVEERGFFRGNGVAMVGIGIIKQSTANTLTVAKLAKKEMLEVRKSLPLSMEIDNSYDTSVFIDSAIHEVYKTFAIAIILVILVIYLFLGNLRAVLVPAVAVPVSITASFIVLYLMGYTINLLTLLALVLAIGLVVDDAIVVLENIYRRIELGEPRLLAAYNGTRQVGFAVIATSLVLIVVFIPITFLEGDVGRLFSEFAFAMAAGVAFSSVVALSLSPMLASKILDKQNKHNRLTLYIDKKFNKLRAKYISSLTKILARPTIVIITIIASLIIIFFLFRAVPSEFTPKEDRGIILLIVQAPEGSSDNYTSEHMKEIEKRLMPFVETGEFRRLIMRTPGSFSTTQKYNSGIGIIVLAPWAERKIIWYYLGQIMQRISDISGVRAFPIPPQAFSRGAQKPVEFVLGGSTYEELADWRDIILEAARENTKLQGLDSDYKETTPQIAVTIERDRAAVLGVSVLEINSALETMLGAKRVTTFIDRGEEYDVIMQADKAKQKNPTDMQNIYVRSSLSNQLIPLSNLVKLDEFADSSKLNRYARLRAITLEANLAEGYILGDALNYLDNLAKTKLPSSVVINYKGESLNYKESGSKIYFIFALALLIVFLVMAAQFESYVHPLVIMFTVPLAILGALFGLFITFQSLNIYSQIGLIMLIGLATKNGILIVEFINQLRDEGKNFEEAIIEASSIRLRPIIMTSVATIMGAVPLILSFGAGAETRRVIGIVVFFGVIVSTMFTIYIIPVMYKLLARNTGSPNKIGKRLEQQLKDHQQ